ncbi:hypothetical protein [Pseudomonas sp. LB3P58]
MAIDGFGRHSTAYVVTAKPSAERFSVTKPLGSLLATNPRDLVTFVVTNHQKGLNNEYA